MGGEDDGGEVGGYVGGRGCGGDAGAGFVEEGAGGSEDVAEVIVVLDAGSVGGDSVA